MNIQIFGTKKSFDTKKAQRYFKERRIKVQFIDLKEKEMSKGELTSVMQAVGGIDKLLNPKAKDEEMLALTDEIPLMRLGTAEEAAKAIFFLASEDSAYITGQVLGVDGGFR